MKTLSSYTEARTTELLNSTGAFFAFSQKQFEEKQIDGVDYVSMGNGLIAPKNNTDKIVEGFNVISSESIAQDIAENGKPAIIRRELANHEAQITSDISDTVEALEGYGITEIEVRAQWGAFFQDCIDNDYF
tara:strand:- start:164 stop:559 length:396 start_codon:yes stop_codon:yes gene_type:complete